MPMEHAFILRECLDSLARAEACRRALDVPRDDARRLGESALAIVAAGRYTNDDRVEVEIGDLVGEAIAAKRSIPPDAVLPTPGAPPVYSTTLQVVNETTLDTALWMVPPGERTLTLNFANGAYPGGGFLHGARAQEECLCRSSALWHTLVDDPMYAAHLRRPLPDSTSWAILSPGVPIFRGDKIGMLRYPGQLDFLTCAAPVAQRVGLERSRALMHERIHRVLEIARAYEYEVLVLGAWGCGAFGNDPVATARSFRFWLEGEFRHAFRHLFFAIADWSPERRFLGPFRDVFAE